MIIFLILNYKMSILKVKTKYNAKIDNNDTKRHSAIMNDLKTELDIMLLFTNNLKVIIKTPAS